jgi:hypothetical protein
MTMKQKPNNVAIYIGQDPKSIAEARGAINDILRCALADQTTKVEALKVLGALCSINDASINNCNIRQ